MINRLELLTDATVVDDAIRFISERSKEKLKPYSANSSEDQPEEKKQAEKTGDINATITKYSK